MPTITGQLKNSANELITGQLWILLDGPLKDTSTTPDSVLLPILRKFNIVAGNLNSLNLNLPESATQQVSYRFRVFEYLPGSSSEVYQIPTMDFRSFVPNVASVEFDDLLPVNISNETIGINAAAIAQILATTPQYAALLRGDPNYLGPYNAIQGYKKGEAVKFAGSWWIFISETPTSGVEPSAVPPGSNFWMSIGEKGDPGGTGGNDVPFGAGWNGATWAPTANALYDYLITLATSSQLATYAPLNAPSFTGIPSRSINPLSGSNSTELATTAWSRSLFALLDSPVFTGNPSAPTQPITDISNKIATTSFARQAAIELNGSIVLALARISTDQALTANSWNNPISWNSEISDPLNAWTSGTPTIFTGLPTARYRISVKIYVTAANALGLFAIGLYENGILIDVLHYDTKSGSITGQSCFCDVNLVNSNIYDIRVFINGGVTSPVLAASGLFGRATLTVQRFGLVA